MRSWRARSPLDQRIGLQCSELGFRVAHFHLRFEHLHLELAGVEPRLKGSDCLHGLRAWSRPQHLQDAEGEGLGHGGGSGHLGTRGIERIKWRRGKRAHRRKQRQRCYELAGPHVLAVSQRFRKDRREEIAHQKRFYTAMR